MLNNIQVLRAVAVVCVVITHVVGAASLYGPDSALLKILDGWGLFGVDLFFVISGFVMAYTHSTNPKSIKLFILNRLLRIAPLYWVITISLACVLLSMPGIFSSLRFDLYHIVASLFFMSKFLTANEPLVLVGWTLEYEMLFYVVFAFCLTVASDRVRYVILLIVLCAISLLTKNYLYLEFVFGIIVFLIVESVELKSTSAWFMLIVGSFMLFFNKLFISYDLNRLIWYGLPAAFLVLGAVSVMQIECKVFVILGDASFSIYLIQALTIVVFYKAINILDFSSLDPLLCFFVALLSTVIIGLIVHNYLDKPLVAYLKSKAYKLIS
jgi:exopolysaccharide production protein ExoZ